MDLEPVPSLTPEKVTPAGRMACRTWPAVARARRRPPWLPPRNSPQLLLGSLSWKRRNRRSSWSKKSLKSLKSHRETLEISREKILPKKSLPKTEKQAAKNDNFVCHKVTAATEARRKERHRGAECGVPRSDRLSLSSLGAAKGDRFESPPARLSCLVFE